MLEFSRRLVVAALAIGSSQVALRAQVCFETALGTNLALTDDSVSTPQSLGFNFPFGGVTHTSIVVSSNGFIWLDATASNSRCCGGSSPLLLSDAPSICPFWTDLVPSLASGVFFNTLTNPNRAVVTWDQTTEYGQPTSNAMTIQCQLFDDGRILFYFDGGARVRGHTLLVGMSPGRSAPDPGASDLSTLPFLAASDSIYETFSASSFDLTGSSIEFLPAAPTQYLVLARPQCQSASIARFGEGCPNPQAVYELFSPGAIDLSNQAIAMTPATAGGYDLTACTQNCFDQNFSNPIPLTDDSVSAQLPLGFTFDYPGGSTSVISIASNGFIWLQPQQSASSRCCSGNPTAFAADPPSIAPMWTDLNPSVGGSVYFDALPGRALITFVGVPEYSNQGNNTFQLQLHASGLVLMAYQSVATVSHTVLAGFSAGGVAPVPAGIDFTASLPFSTGPSGRPLSLDPAAGTIPRLGTNFAVVTSDIPSSAVAGTLMIGFAQLAIDLGPVGFPGCSLLQSAEAIGGFGTGQPTSTFNLPVPNSAALAGAVLYGQSAALLIGGSGVGIAMSNGLRIGIGI